MKEEAQTNGWSVAGKESSQGSRGDSNEASPAAVEKYIRGIHFPADKKKLISQAEQNSAPSDVMPALNRFEEKQFSSLVDVAKEVGRIE